MYEGSRGLRFGIVEFDEPLQALKRNYSIWKSAVRFNLVMCFNELPTAYCLPPTDSSLDIYVGCV
jgi:hypothetical protein